VRDAPIVPLRHGHLTENSEQAQSVPGSVHYHIPASDPQQPYGSYQDIDNNVLIPSQQWRKLRDLLHDRSMCGAILRAASTLGQLLLYMLRDQDSNLHPDESG